MFFYQHAATRSHSQPLEWPQVAASGRSKRVAASGRKWPLQASGRKWPQVAASGRKWPLSAISISTLKATSLRVGIFDGLCKDSQKTFPNSLRIYKVALALGDYLKVRAHACIGGPTLKTCFVMFCMHY